MSIYRLLQSTGMWRASGIDCDRREGTPTGFARLDQYLPGGGWPADGIAELLHDYQGIGELRLLAPALARLSREQARWLLWVCPPYVPYAPALAHAGIDLSRILVVTPKKRADILWTLEQALTSGSCSMVLAWPGNIRDKEVRRLQVASREGHSLGILFRHGHAARQSSPAELRIRLYSLVPGALSEHSGMQLRILKRRGGWPTDIFTVEFNDKLNQMSPDFSEIPVIRKPLPDGRSDPYGGRSPLVPPHAPKHPD